MFLALHRTLIVLTFASLAAAMHHFYYHPDIMPTFADRYVQKKEDAKLAAADALLLKTNIACQVDEVLTGRSFVGKDVFGRSYNLGLAGLNVPESVQRTSQKTLEEMTKGKMVRFEINYYSNDRTAALGVLSLDGTNINELMLEKGLAVLEFKTLEFLPSYRRESQIQAQKRGATQHAAYWSPIPLDDRHMLRPLKR